MEVKKKKKYIYRGFQHQYVRQNGVGEIVKGTAKRVKCKPIAGVLAVETERKKGGKKLFTEFGN